MIRNNLTIERKPKYYEDKYCVRFVQYNFRYDMNIKEAAKVA